MSGSLTSLFLIQGGIISPLQMTLQSFFLGMALLKVIRGTSSCIRRGVVLRGSMRGMLPMLPFIMSCSFPEVNWVGIGASQLEDSLLEREILRGEMLLRVLRWSLRQITMPTVSSNAGMRLLLSCRVASSCSSTLLMAGLQLSSPD